MKYKEQIIGVCAFLLVAVPLFAQTAYFRTTIQSGGSAAAPFCTPCTATKENRQAKTAIPAQSMARICNSTLYFTLPAAAGAQELNITLRDLQGRTVWTGHRGGSSILGGQQAFAIRREQDSLLSGTYLLTVWINNSAGIIVKFEQKVMAVD